MKADTIAGKPGPSPDTLTETANLAARSKLMSALTVRVQSWGVTQEVAACRLGIDRPRLNNLLRGKMAKFSLDALLNLAVVSGLSVHIEIT